MVSLFDKFFTTIQTDVLNYYIEKYPQYTNIFNEKIDYWRKETKGMIQAGHLFDVLYSTISGKKADPYYCLKLNQKQRDVMLQVINLIGSNE